MVPSLPDFGQSASTADGRDNPTATIASPPFDDPKADLIIRSSDNILFYVHKSLLSIVSPVFEGMFELPNITSQELYDNRLCLPVTEDSRHLFCLLSWCDPRCSRPSPTLNNLEMTLSIAHKYRMDSIFAHAQKELLARDFPGSESLRVFAIATLFRLDMLAQKAARATLGVPLALCNNSPQLKQITAFALQNLHNYHYECKMAVRYLLASDSWDQAMKSMIQHLMSQESEAKAQCHTHDIEYFSLKKVLVMKDRVLWTCTEHAAPWWSSYVDVTMHNLNERPGSFKIPVSQVQRLQQLISLEECDLCKRHGYKRLNEISQFLSKEIDEAISKVSFRVEY